MMVLLYSIIARFKHLGIFHEIDEYKQQFQSLGYKDETNKLITEQTMHSLVTEGILSYKPLERIFSEMTEKELRFVFKMDEEYYSEEHLGAIEIIRQVKTKQSQRKQNKPSTPFKLHPIYRGSWAIRLAGKLAELCTYERDASYFTNYDNKLYHTHDIDKFRFWLRKYTTGGYYYEFTFNFYDYEYEFCEQKNGFIFTRKADREKSEVVCFIAYLGGYWRSPAKLLKGIYNRETKEFTPKNINFIKKYL